MKAEIILKEDREGEMTIDAIKGIAITWNIRRENNLCISSYIFANLEKLREGIRRTGTVSFVVRHKTKTSVAIEISCPEDDGRHNFNVAYIPSGAEKFKFHNKVTYGVFDSKPRERHYFKIGKKQGLPELKEYLGLVLHELLPDMESVTAELVLYKLPEIEC